MQPFIEIYGFLSVVLRGVALSAQSFTVGGLAFLVLLVWPLRDQLGPATGVLARRVLRTLCWSASALVAAELLAGASLTVMLMGTLDIPLREAMGARAVMTDIMAAGVAGFIAIVAYWGQIESIVLRAATPLLAALLLVMQVGSTHAVSQFHSAGLLSLAEFLHMIGAAVWIGGIPYLLTALEVEAPAAARIALASRFSRVAIIAVLTLLAGGLIMAGQYVGTPEAFYGSSYGVMVSAKIVLLTGLLFLGGLNYLAVRRLKQEPAGPLLRTRRFAEVEVGIGLTVLFCAASLASLPPARDTVDSQATFEEVVERIAPRFPVRLDSPDFAALSAAQPAEATTNIPAAAQPSRKLADIAWSEYNHHWAGVFVVIMGVLALLERVSPRLAPFARNWPMIFLGLAGFLFLRADESVWPLGRLGLIESLRDPEIAQHRLLTLFIVAFGVFEWRVRTGRSKAGWAPYVFPLSTAVAAAFLLTHSHGLTNLKEETLIEITHTPLALAGVAAGWARWLELRTDGEERKIAGLVWPLAFILAGLTLVFYREA